MVVFLLEFMTAFLWIVTWGNSICACPFNFSLISVQEPLKVGALHNYFCAVMCSIVVEKYFRILMVYISVQHPLEMPSSTMKCYVKLLHLEILLVFVWKIVSDLQCNTCNREGNMCNIVAPQELNWTCKLYRSLHGSSCWVGFWCKYILSRLFPPSSSLCHGIRMLNFWNTICWFLGYSWCWSFCVNI